MATNIAAIIKNILIYDEQSGEIICQQIIVRSVNFTVFVLESFEVIQIEEHWVRECVILGYGIGWVRLSHKRLS